MPLTELITLVLIDAWRTLTGRNRGLDARSSRDLFDEEEGEEERRREESR